MAVKMRARYQDLADQGSKVCAVSLVMADLMGPYLGGKNNAIPTTKRGKLRAPQSSKKHAISLFAA